VAPNLVVKIMKPKMELFITDDNYRLVERARSILSASGMRKEAKEIHQRATAFGYDLFIVLQLLKEYMNI